MTDDIEGSVRGLRDKASETTRRVSDGITQMEEAAEAVERANEAIEGARKPERKREEPAAP